MFQAERRSTGAGKLVATLDLIYHNIVRKARASHRDAVLAIVMTILQNLAMMLVFFWFMSFMGIVKSAVRGDFMLFIMSGVFMFMTHTQAVGAVAGSDGPTSPMMLHQPMNVVIAIWSAALSALYRQVVSMIVILGGYHLMWKPITIDQPFGVSMMLLLAWFSGCAVGSVFLAITPWLPTFSGMARMTYQRLNMFASGKMFVANQMPAKIISVFAWNPLFHIIDQARGYAFINYNPMKSNLTYPIVVSLVLLAIGLILDSKTRKHVSVSWTAGR